ncbi:hypothetical protein Dimus_037957 [Dionaea muscipula]
MLVLIQFFFRILLNNEGLLWVTDGDSSHKLQFDAQNPKRDVESMFFFGQLMIWYIAYY